MGEEEGVLEKEETVNIEFRNYIMKKKREDPQSTHLLAAYTWRYYHIYSKSQLQSP